MLLVYLLFLTFGSSMSEEKEFVDLTHPFANGFTWSWPWFDDFKFVIKERGFQSDGLYLEYNDFSQPEHCGTHMDAPAHFAEGGLRIGQIPVEKLIGPGLVIDIEERANDDPDTMLNVTDLEAWESEFGQIPDGAIVIMRTGFGKHYGTNKTAYLGWPAGIEESNPRDTKNLHFPGFDPIAAQWLVDNRNILGVAVDVISQDRGQSHDFKAHQIFAANNIWGVENLANAEKLPLTGFTVYNMVYRLQEGSGAPTRIFAILGDSISGADDVFQSRLLISLLSIVFVFFFGI